MLDTIHLQVDNLEIHTDLIRYLEIMAKTKKTSAPNIPTNVFNPNINYGMVNFADSNRQYIGMKRVGKFENSRNMDVTYILDESKDRLMFNISVPKYLYGNNIQEFIIPSTTRNFDYGRYSVFENQIHSVYEMLFQVLQHFTKNTCNSLVNINFLHLIRIDFCYNHYFEDVEKKYEYFRNIKNSKLKSFSQSKNYLTSSYQDSTAFWHSRIQSFKVYDKYEEYKDNDYKRIITYDKTKADRLLIYSKHILRFEHTIRLQQLNNIYIRYRAKEVGYENSLYRYYNIYTYLRTLKPQQLKEALKKSQDNVIAWSNRKNYKELNKVKKIYFINTNTSDELYLSRSYFVAMVSSFESYLLSFFRKTTTSSHSVEKYSKDFQRKMIQFDYIYRLNECNYKAMKHLYAESTFYRLQTIHKKCFADNERHSYSYMNNYKMNKYN